MLEEELQMSQQIRGQGGHFYLRTNPKIKTGFVSDIKYFLPFSFLQNTSVVAWEILNKH